MMADNIEHVISYWVVFQKFHSPALGGFAVVSHWLPFLLFSVASGALADRFDPRRVIQAGMALFIIASLSWGYFFFTGGLQMWQAMVILVIHGCAGVLWQTPTRCCSTTSSAHRTSKAPSASTPWHDTSASCWDPRSAAPFWLRSDLRGASCSNTVFYLPLVLWLVSAPYGPKFRAGIPPPKRAVRGLNDILTTAREIKDHTTIVSMVLLAGAASFLVGNAYSSQMRGFAADLHHGDPSVAYSMLPASDAAGGLLAGLVLEGGGFLAPRPRTAIILALLWCSALTVFSLAGVYWLAVGLLFLAGFLELSFNAMA